MAKKRFYNYLYSFPLGFADLGGIVFYVGKGTGKRCMRHIREARSQCGCEKCQSIRKVWASGKQVQIDIVNETDYEQDALRCERELISQHRSAHLTNVANNSLPLLPVARKRKKDSAKDAKLRWWSIEVYKAIQWLVDFGIEASCDMIAMVSACPSAHVEETIESMMKQGLVTLVNGVVTEIFYIETL